MEKHDCESKRQEKELNTDDEAKTSQVTGTEWNKA